MKVYLGGSLKAYGTDWQFVSGQVIGTGCTWGQISGEPKIYINSMSAATAQVEINIQLLGVQLTKVFTVTKTITGAQGLQGALVRTTEHAIGFEYRNDLNLTSAPRYLDVVTMYISNVARMFKCKITHTSSSATQPPNTTYWEEFNQTAPIYTSLILATNAVIRFLQGNQMVMQKADGTVTAGMSGAGSGATGIRMWAGGSVPGLAPFRVNELGSVFADDALIKGILTSPWAPLLAVLTLPSRWNYKFETIFSDGKRSNYVAHVSTSDSWLELPSASSYYGASVRVYVNSTSTYGLKVETGYLLNKTSYTIAVGQMVELMCLNSDSGFLGWYLKE